MAHRHAFKGLVGRDARVVSRDALESRADEALPTATISFSLGEEAETIRWMHDEGQQRESLPHYSLRGHAGHERRHPKGCRRGLSGVDPDRFRLAGAGEGEGPEEGQELRTDPFVRQRTASLPAAIILYEYYLRDARSRLPTPRIRI